MLAQESSCGSSSVAFSTYVAGLVAGRHLSTFESCCEVHDICYDSCTLRDNCDRDFGLCMRNGCAHLSEEPSDFDECVNKSGVFLSAVENFGSFAYGENCTRKQQVSPAQFVYDMLEISTSGILEMLAI